MAEATLTISSRNYSSWSLRGWLLCRMAGLDLDVEVLSGDPASRAELLHLSPSFLVPRLTHGAVRVWDVLAIAQYLTEIRPEAGLLPDDLATRSWSRSISGEMHGGFFNLRSALPMNLRARYADFTPWGGAQADIARVVEIWQEALRVHGGPFLFGARPVVADAMYAPVCTRFVTYGVALPSDCAAYRDRIMDWDLMRDWIAAAQDEPEEIEELDMEF
ncbi:glutathione S-transferase family protein [Methylobacterium platani]|uniref:Glutathione S-transferase n=2 Tax=Methylobacterium platani TaxID=427683 RepID=A0A179SA86_9HYPH|nr:glutathione S-transferase family protein [Methylobacterium platani]KMO12458.1 glutathione S-transferase [Methylobacterium platani JCM 14648]OAS24517.1 glutathione S-transferase [Methylobacterium platani]